MTTYADLLAAYVAAPGPDTLDELRSAIRATPGFLPDVDVTTTVRPLIAAGAYEEAVHAVQEMMPGAFLSPAAHACLAEALAGTGQAEAAARETGLARTALRSILGTGDGSPERPWSVLRVSDEYDVLRALQKRPDGQALVRHGHRSIDVLTCEDGTELHFDVTELVGRT